MIQPFGKKIVWSTQSEHVGIRGNEVTDKQETAASQDNVTLRIRLEDQLSAL